MATCSDCHHEFDIEKQYTTCPHALFFHVQAEQPTIDELVSRITSENQHEAQPAETQLPACKGMNCGCTDGRSHSLECQAEHAAAIAGGVFVKRETASLEAKLAAEREKVDKQADKISSLLGQIREDEKRIAGFREVAENATAKLATARRDALLRLRMRLRAEVLCPDLDRTFGDLIEKELALTERI